MSHARGTGAVVWTIATTQFASPFMFSGVGITLPPMGREFGASGVELSLVETLYLVLSAVLVLPAGRLADAGDKNTFFTVGLTLFTATTLALGSVDAITPFLVLRGVQGAGAALILATNMAILTELVPRERLGRAIGLSIGAVYAGLAAGPFLGGLITSGLGWRWVHRVGFLVLLVATLLAWAGLRRAWVWPRLRFDFAGALTSGLALICFVVGAARLGHAADAFVALAAGVALLALFVFVERRVRDPLVDLEALLGNGVLARALVVQLMTYAGSFGTTFLFSIHLQVALGFTARAAGQILIVSPILMAVFAPISGRLADRFSARWLSLIGVALIFTGTLAAILVAGSRSLVALYVSLAAHGLGFAVFSSPNMAIIMASAGRGATSMASALAAQMRQVGMVAGMALITACLSIMLGNASVDAATVGGFASAMRWALSGLALCGAGAVALAVRDARSR